MQMVSKLGLWRGSSCVPRAKRYGAVVYKVTLFLNGYAFNQVNCHFFELVLHQKHIVNIQFGSALIGAMLCIYIYIINKYLKCKAPHLLKRFSLCAPRAPSGTEIALHLCLFSMSWISDLPGNGKLNFKKNTQELPISISHASIGRYVHSRVLIGFSMQ